MSGGIVRADLPAVQVKEGGLQEGERVGEGGVGGEEEGVEGWERGEGETGGESWESLCGVRMEVSGREESFRLLWLVGPGRSGEKAHGEGGWYVLLWRGSSCCGGMEGDSPQPGMKRAGGLPLNISCRVQRHSTKREKVEEGTS